MRLLRRALPISLLILRKKPTVLQSKSEPANTAVSPSSSGQGTFPPGEGMLKAERSCLDAIFKIHLTVKTARIF